MKFLPAAAEEILIQNITTNCDCLLNVFCYLRRNADVIMCREKALQAYLSQLVLSVTIPDGELNLVH